jgi:hypothetical protein
MIRHYPKQCRSEYCGKAPDKCKDCTHHQTMQDFTDWVKATNAKPDPVYSAIYEAEDCK